uniref:Innexin n=1 Tax=Caenorhabditis tropicalis TaxID=1561998 RepID=A0A1I7T0S1_9PELO
MLGFFGPIYEHLAGMLRKQQGQLAYDTIDRVNAWFTPFVLVAMTLAISCKQYFGQPLKCWTPREFSGSWDGYVHDFCFIENTYFVPNGTEVTDQVRGDRHINYYRWVPLVLLLQAAMFIIPYNIWNIFHKKTNINLKGCLRFFEGAMKKQEAGQACEAFSREIWGKLIEARKSTNKFYGCQATINFFLLKLGFLINCILQMVLLKHFLDVDDYFWGFFHLWNVEFKGTAEKEDSIFPRVVLCDFKVRNFGQQQQHTVSCIMILNMIIEKLYICFYFWLIFVFVLTAAGMMNFGFQLLFRRHSLIPTNLNNKRSMNPTRSHRFIRKYLNFDGVLLLTFVDAQFGAYRTSQVIDGLIERFVAEQQPDSSTVTSLNEESPERYVTFNADTIPMDRMKRKTHTLLDEVDSSSARPSAPSAVEEKKEM